ncbi:DNA repair protein RecO [Ramlibacter tataouinensis]|uniref:DNA repair protein RecO n=1 Tax=Ramlibacter tataouinensis TaxID=94132 RepID=A0A127JPZ2_9BURK|nr:DNA repair protein RecO [Ramlibacter tataouinensis]AMO22098.1 DNA recombination protein RecO [Ramlibacter tataouinensis]
MAKRIGDEPAFVLHRYDWSESSLILETFTRHYGRIALVAKGAKRPSSNFRPVLLPLQPLRIAFGGDAEIRTLKGAEWTGGQGMPAGGALLSGLHINELLLRLLARDDPHPRLFDAYAGAVGVLGFQQAEAIEPALRAFELILLREVGLLPALNMQTLTLAPVEAEELYTLLPEAGLIAMGEQDERPGLPGDHWSALEAALGDAAPFQATLRAAASCGPGLKPQLRALLHYHCGVSQLRTRQLMIDLQLL